MSRCDKAVNDGIDLGDLLPIVPLTDDFLGSTNRAGGGGGAKKNQCGWLFLLPALILMDAW